MYTQQCGYDGMEYSISGDGIRPTINSYMAADKYALALLAERAGDPKKADFFLREADTLRQQINEVLWNEDIGMFGVISKEGEKQNVREQIGYIPWTYGLADDGRDGCFQNLLDPTCFLAPHGLRTADASHPDYRKEFNHECLWNGPVWPYATAQTLTSVIEYLNTTEHPTITPKDFTQLLLTYAYSHRDTDGSPYLDENMDPDTGIWLAREIMRGWNNPKKEYTNCPDCKSQNIEIIKNDLENKSSAPQIFNVPEASKYPLNERRSFGGSGSGRGPSKACECPNCGYIAPKIRGFPCRNIKCPECGTPLCGSNHKEKS
jgi:hypothetical protein